MDKWEWYGGNLPHNWKNHALGAARMNCHLRTLSRILLIKQNYIMLIMIIMIIVMISITVSSKNDL